jgi:FdhD protein
VPIPRSVSIARVHECRDGELHVVDDYVVGEEPLEIRIADAPLSVTMRTPGHDLELAAGFVFTEGIVRSREQISSVSHAPDEKQNGANRVRIELAPGVQLDPELTRRNFYAASSCGICGKASIEAVRVRGIAPANPEFVLAPDVLWNMPDKLRAAQAIFGRTGGLHAAGLFDAGGQLLVLREDVGRHNAVDKAMGWALLEGRVPLREHVLLVSGRGGFEIVQKAAVAGVPVIASVSAPSDLAVNLARELGLTLVGFLRGHRFVIYTGERRLQPMRQPPPSDSTAGRSSA